MPSVQYGTTKIRYSHIIDNSLKHGYITVDFYKGVILKTPFIDDSQADEAVASKGKWILEKIKLVERIPRGEIITGTRLLYLGRRYYVQMIDDRSIKGAIVKFNHSKFKISVNPDAPDRSLSINTAMEKFLRDKAVIKITPRINRWSEGTGFIPSSIHFRKLSKRWGSCTNANEIIINFDAVKLPFALIDYIILHELTHIKHKYHSKDFYREMAESMPDWEELNEKLGNMKL